MLKWRPTHLTTATTTLWPLSWDSRWAASMETSSLLVVLNFRTPPSLHHQRLLRPTFPEIVLIATEVTIHWLNSYILDLPWRAIHIMKIFFPGQFRSPSETLLWRRFCYPTFSEQKQKTTHHKFSQLVTLPTHIDGGAFFSIITIKSFNGFKVVKLPTPEYISYLQEYWTKHIFAKPRKSKKCWSPDLHTLLQRSWHCNCNLEIVGKQPQLKHHLY